MIAARNMDIFKALHVQPIFSFLSVQISEIVSVITHIWEMSVVDTLVHTHTHSCSLHLKARFPLQLETPRCVQIPLRSERWDLIKPWQQIFWCVWCAFTSGICITQQSLQEREEACTRKVSRCKVTWRREEKENAIIKMWICPFLPRVSICMCYFLFPNHRTDSQFHRGSFTPPWHHHLPNSTRSSSSTLTKPWTPI